MSNITIISGTNREDSYTFKVAQFYFDYVCQKYHGGRVVLADFRDLPKDIAFEEVYGKRSQKFEEYIQNYIAHSDKFFWIVPEYNGSYAGISKLFIDAIHPRYFYYKKVCLTGVASGRAGNLRGIDHLAMVLQYLRMNVFYNKLPISRVEEVWGEKESKIQEQKEAIIQQIEEFLRY